MTQSVIGLLFPLQNHTKYYILKEIVMNCKNCGAPFENNLSKCPYCQTPNPEADKHKTAIRHLSGEIIRTRQKLSETTEKYVRIVILCVLIILITSTLFAISRSWEFAEMITRHEVTANRRTYLSRLEQYESEDDFLALAALYDDKWLYGIDDFRKYEYISSISSAYQSIYYQIVSFLDGEHWENENRQMLLHLLDNIEYYYETLENHRYSFLEPYGTYDQVHLDAAERVTEKLEDLLQFTFRISAEDMKNFRELPTTEKLLLIERSFQNNE